MAKVQKQFDQFDKQIRLGRFSEEETLREKRDRVRSRLDSRLPEVFEAHEEANLVPEYRDQGSYEMGTGVKPLEGDFDIDQGVYFDIATDAYDPVVLKKRIHEALDGHTKSVRIRRPCVTVEYQSNDEPLYHVDLAIYSRASANADGKDRLAVGRKHSSSEHRSWDVSDPQGLSETIMGRFPTAPERSQFRRVVRYLKRWKDENFRPDGNGAPLGIGLTVASYDELRPRFSDPVSKKPDDLLALRDLTTALLRRFRSVWDEEEQEWVERLEIGLPVEPWNDLFERMTHRQMGDFQDKLQHLDEALLSAIEAVDPVEACETLRSVFGHDFPVPDKNDTAKKHAAPAVVGSSRSA